MLRNHEAHGPRRMSLCPGAGATAMRSTPLRLSCRDQEGRRGSEEAVPGPSVLPSREPGVSGDFWWLAFPFSRGSSQPRDRTQVSCTAGGFFTS